MIKLGIVCDPCFVTVCITDFLFLTLKKIPVSVFLLVIITLNAFDGALMVFIYFLAELSCDR